MCAHIVQAIRKETKRVQDEWQAALTNNSAKQKNAEDANRLGNDFSLYYYLGHLKYHL